MPQTKTALDSKNEVAETGNKEIFKASEQQANPPEIIADDKPQVQTSGAADKKPVKPKSVKEVCKEIEQKIDRMIYLTNELEKSLEK